MIRREQLEPERWKDAPEEDDWEDVFGADEYIMKSPLRRR
jgi:hypothetical protein